MSTLHLINRSPFTSQVTVDVEAALSSGDHILLIEDGVYAVLAGKRLFSTVDAHVGVLLEDCQARGIALTPDMPQAVDMAGFVRLTAETERTVSWF